MYSCVRRLVSFGIVIHKHTLIQLLYYLYRYILSFSFSFFSFLFCWLFFLCSSCFLFLLIFRISVFVPLFLYIYIYIYTYFLIFSPLCFRYFIVILLVCLNVFVRRFLLVCYTLLRFNTSCCIIPFRASGQLCGFMSASISRSQSTCLIKIVEAGFRILEEERCMISSSSVEPSNSGDADPWGGTWRDVRPSFASFGVAEGHDCKVSFQISIWENRPRTWES